MFKKTKQNRHLIFLAFFFFLFFILFGFFVIFQLRMRNDINILKNYRISYTEENKETANLLSRLCQDKLQIEIRQAYESSHLFLKLSADEEEAAAFGFPLQELDEKGFLIAHHGNILYLLSKSTEGLQRACFYLVYQLTDQDGKLLLKLGERYVNIGSDVYRELFIGDIPINDYSVICSKNVPSSLGRDLQYYITQPCGLIPALKEEASDSPYILLAIDNSLDIGSYKINGSDGNIYISGADAEALNDGICVFANTYLNWMYAGTSQEEQGSHSGTLCIPNEFSDAEESWIKEREAIVTLWNIYYSRGVFYNNSTSLKNDIMSFSDDQLYEYVRMLKYCGFTGIQVTDMCSAWAGAGSYEYVHERLRVLADAAHSLDMKFTLWVWGAEFTGYGWSDSSVTYSSGEYEYAYQNPAVQATFEKYYSIYAELADCCDRVIAHYYDPGQLSESVDIAYFAKMLSEKFLTVNPEIDFGISCWVDKYDKNTFLHALGNNITLYECGHHDNLEEYISFRAFCANNNCRLGTWAWNTCEMEIDQLAQMNYNPHIIQSVYQNAIEYDDILKPQYWSEMDSYHVLNVFSLYCAGQLLIEPSREIDELTYEISLATVGKDYAEEFADILDLIEDARSGEGWDTYWWSSENYILKSDEYPAEELLTRCNQAINVLQEMLDSDLQANTLPLPLELKDVLQLMLPHIQQIKAYAEFRIGLEQAQNMLADNAPLADIQAQIDAISTPISEYNTIIGLWGQIEARAQQELLWDFCQKNNLNMPTNATFDYDRKFRIYSQFITDQKGQQEPVYHYPPYYQYNLAYGSEITNMLTEELIEEGLLTKDESTGAVYLTDWEHYVYSFN